MIRPSLTGGLSVWQVWASKWNERAYLSCRKARINHDDLSMAVLCQQVIRADYAYVIHTTNPSSGDPNEIYAEVVRGLGETLVGAYSGRALSFAATKSDLQPKVTHVFLFSSPLSEGCGEAEQEAPQTRLACLLSTKGMVRCPENWIDSRMCFCKVFEKGVSTFQQSASGLGLCAPSAKAPGRMQARLVLRPGRALLILVETCSWVLKSLHATCDTKAYPLCIAGPR